jgi:hypothetical protein
VTSHCDRVLRLFVPELCQTSNYLIMIQICHNIEPATNCKSTRILCLNTRALLSSQGIYTQPDMCIIYYLHKIACLPSALQYPAITQYPICLAPILSLASYLYPNVYPRSSSSPNLFHGSESLNAQSSYSPNQYFGLHKMFIQPNRLTALRVVKRA